MKASIYKLNFSFYNKFFFSIIAILVTSVFLSACEEDADNKIAQAQQCLDRLRSTSPSGDAQACMDKISGIESAEANIIRCHASFFIGGINTGSIVQAITDYDNAVGADKEATLLVGLRQSPDVNRSQETYEYCSKTGIPGLVYMATISNMGTIIDSVGNGVNPADSVANCVTNNNCNETEIGEMAVNLYDIYCVGQATTNQICIDINSSIQSAGESNYSGIGDLLLQYFN